MREFKATHKITRNGITEIVMLDIIPGNPLPGVIGINNGDGIAYTEKVWRDWNNGDYSFIFIAGHWVYTGNDGQNLPFTVQEIGKKTIQVIPPYVAGKIMVTL